MKLTEATSHLAFFADREPPVDEDEDREHQQDGDGRPAPRLQPDPGPPNAFPS
jgi:hypothetical protein